MSDDNKENLFGNTENTGAEVAETTKTDTPEVADAPKRTRTASPATQLKVELKAAIKAKAMGSTGLEKLQAEQKAVTDRLAVINGKIEEALNVGSDEEMDARIANLKSKLMDAITAEVS